MVAAPSRSRQSTPPVDSTRAEGKRSVLVWQWAEIQALSPRREGTTPTGAHQPHAHRSG